VVVAALVQQALPQPASNEAKGVSCWSLKQIPSQKSPRSSVQPVVTQSLPFWHSPYACSSLKHEFSSGSQPPLKAFVKQASSVETSLSHWPLNKASQVPVQSSPVHAP